MLYPVLHMPIAPDALLALLSAFSNAISTLLLKHAYAKGARSYQQLIIVNGLQAPLFGILLLFAPPIGAIPVGTLLGYPLLGTFTYLVAQFVTLLAIRHGDVSIQTPIMGTKVVFVSILSVILLGADLSADLWIGSVATMIAIFLLGLSATRGSGFTIAGVALALASAASFAAMDIILVAGSRQLHPFIFMPIMMTGASLVGSIPLLLRPKLVFPFPPSGRGALFVSGVFMALQSVAIAVAISVFRNPTLVNIVYGTRGLWSILLIVLVGKHLGNREHDIGAPRMAMRFAGAGVLLAALVLVL